jgi:hypothetical protein
MALLLMMVMAGGAARADHTKEDAQATTRKLDAILHPKKAKPKVAAKAKPPAATAEAPAEPAAAHAGAEAAKPVVDPLFAIIAHAMAIPFDEKEREAHLRDIPKNAKELDAHLRRLDGALEAQHHHR